MAFAFSGNAVALGRSRVTPLGGSGRLVMCAAPGVAVAGATGRTGRLVVNRLLELGTVPVRALARSTDKATEVLPEDPRLEVLPLDLAAPKATLDKQLADALMGVGALVILTSAVPQMVQGSNPPSFTYPSDGMPEEVDWKGGKAQVDAALKAGVKRILVVGSMGSTDPDNALNKIGNGNILKWKRRLQQYVIECCDSADYDCTYCIMNPGGLTNGLGGVRKLIHGKNDRIMSLLGDRPSVSRDDVAQVVVKAVTENTDGNKCFDLASYPEEPDAKSVNTDFDKLFSEVTPGLE